MIYAVKITLRVQTVRTYRAIRLLHSLFIFLLFRQFALIINILRFNYNKNINDYKDDADYSIKYY